MWGWGYLLIQLELSVAADGDLRLKQSKFTHAGLSLIQQLPEPHRLWTGQDWRIPPQFALSVVKHLNAQTNLQMSDVARTFVRSVTPAPLTKKPPSVSDYKFKTPPYQHQVTAFDLARRFKNYALLMEMGTGKTKAMIDVLSYLMMGWKIEGALILAPKALLYNWEREIGTHSPLAPEGRRCAIITAEEGKREVLMQSMHHAQFFITNYATLRDCYDWLEKLLKVRRLAIVADESTALAGNSSKQSRNAAKLGKLAVARYILTGSPIANSPLDAFGQFRFLNPNILGHQTFTSFKSEYAVTVPLSKAQPHIRIVKNYKNLPRLREMVGKYSYRVLKSECLDLPEKVYRVIDLDMGPKQAELYRQMKEDAICRPLPLEPGLRAPIILTQLLRLQQITSGFVPLLDEFEKEKGIHEIPDAAKLTALVELVKLAVEAGRKVAIWGRFVWEVKTIASTLRGLKMKCVEYYGGVNAKDRQAAVDSIQTGDSQIFVGQTQTGGMGITLTAINKVIYYSNTFSLNDRLQSEDRAHRIGQKQSVEYDDLICRGTVDKLIFRALKNKKNIADIITGDSLKNLLEVG